MQDIYDWIDAHRDELVAELQTLLRQPSISAQKIGLDECAALLRDLWVADGLPDTQILPVPDAPSIVYATEPAPDTRRQDAALLQPLRRAAARAAGAVGRPALQRGDPRRRHLCARRHGQQVGRAGLCARGAGLPGSARRPAGQSRSLLRGRGGSRQPASGRLGRGQRRRCSSATPASASTAACTAPPSSRRFTWASRRSWRWNCASRATASTSGAAAPSCCRRSAAAWRLVHCLGTIFSPEGRILDRRLVRRPAAARRRRSLLAAQRAGALRPPGTGAAVGRDAATFPTTTTSNCSRRSTTARRATSPGWPRATAARA